MGNSSKDSDQSDEDSETTESSSPKSQTRQRVMKTLANQLQLYPFPLPPLEVILEEVSPTASSLELEKNIRLIRQRLCDRNTLDSLESIEIRDYDSEDDLEEIQANRKSVEKTFLRNMSVISYLETKKKQMLDMDFDYGLSLYDVPSKQNAYNVSKFNCAVADGESNVGSNQTASRSDRTQSTSNRTSPKVDRERNDRVSQRNVENRLSHRSVESRLANKSNASQGKGSRKQNSVNSNLVHDLCNMSDQKAISMHSEAYSCSEQTMYSAFNPFLKSEGLHDRGEYMMGELYDRKKDPFYSPSTNRGAGDENAMSVCDCEIDGSLADENGIQQPENFGDSSAFSISVRTSEKETEYENSVTSVGCLCIENCCQTVRNFFQSVHFQIRDFLGR